MKTDLELLEAARIAAGISGGHWEGRVYRTASGNDTWAPMDDDGDAGRLASKLRLSTVQLPSSVAAFANRAYWPELADAYASVYVRATEPDGRNTATRRAIVEAAASIGGSQP